MTTKHPRWQPDWTVLPGETIKETLKERGLTQIVAADRMGMSQSYLSDVIRGHRAISAKIALRLEALTGVSADLWAGLQARHDVAVERRAPSSDHPSRRHFPDPPSQERTEL